MLTYCPRSSAEIPLCKWLLTRFGLCLLPRSRSVVSALCRTALQCHSPCSQANNSCVYMAALTIYSYWYCQHVLRWYSTDYKHTTQNLIWKSTSVETGKQWWLVPWAVVSVTVAEVIHINAVLIQTAGTLLHPGEKSTPVRPSLSSPVQPPGQGRSIWSKHISDNTFLYFASDI